MPKRIWEISQMSGYPGNFPNAWESGKFPKCLGIWEIFQMPEKLGKFPNTWVSGKFLKYLF